MEKRGEGDEGDEKDVGGGKERVRWKKRRLNKKEKVRKLELGR